MSRENQRRDRLLSEGKEEQATGEEEVDKHRLGDRDIHYRYQV